MIHQRKNEHMERFSSIIDLCLDIFPSKFFILSKEISIFLFYKINQNTHKNKKRIQNKHNKNF